jgi:hypothetical protein
MLGNLTWGWRPRPCPAFGPDSGPDRVLLLALWPRGWGITPAAGLRPVAPGEGYPVPWAVFGLRPRGIGGGFHPRWAFSLHLRGWRILSHGLVIGKYTDILRKDFSSWGVGYSGEYFREGCFLGLRDISMKGTLDFPALFKNDSGVCDLNKI